MYMVHIEINQLLTEILTCTTIYFTFYNNLALLGFQLYKVVCD